MKITKKLRILLSLSENTITAVYFNNKYLSEAYNKLNIDIKNIIASLTSTYIKCSIKNNYSDENILEELNKEFVKINTCFEKIKGENNIKYFSKEYGICYGENINGNIYIYVNDIFFNNFKINSEDDFNFDELGKAIFKLYTHEYTHRHQYLHQNIHPTSMEVDDAINNISDYLSNIYEIDAHARSVSTSILLQDYKDIKSIINELNKGAKSLYMNIYDYSLYYRYFGAYSIDMKNIKSNTKQFLFFKEKLSVWNRFLRRIIDFITLDKKYIND